MGISAVISAQIVKFT